MKRGKQWLTCSWKIPSAWEPSKEAQNVLTRVGHYGRDSKAMASVARLGWLVYTTVPVTLLEHVLHLHQWEVRPLLYWSVVPSFSKACCADKFQDIGWLGKLCYSHDDCFSNKYYQAHYCHNQAYNYCHFQCLSCRSCCLCALHGKSDPIHNHRDLLIVNHFGRSDL